VAQAQMEALPPRDEIEFRRDARHTIPLATIGFIERAIDGESLFPAILRPYVAQTLVVLRMRIDTTFPMRAGAIDDSAVQMAGLLHDATVRLALRMPPTFAKPKQAALAAARCERFERFRAAKAVEGIKVSNSQIARTAHVDRTTLRRYLGGEYGPDSVLVERIEHVIG
jgi:hypothetical protein